MDMPLPVPPAHVLTQRVPELYMDFTESTAIVKALIAQESNGDDFAVGDEELKHKAYGPLQIRQPAVDDVNRANGTHYLAEQMKGDRALSIWVFNEYMKLYATEKRIGRKVTDEDRSRIWNGGPMGWKSSKTIEFWADVLVRLPDEYPDANAVGSQEKPGRLT